MTTNTAASAATNPGLTGLLGRVGDYHARLVAHAQPFFLLALRVLFGAALFLAGKGKLANLDGVAAFFADLGIPAARANVMMVGGIEMIGGLLLILGLASRAVSLALVAVLGVALATAHSAEIGVVLSEPGVFIAAAPVPYLIAVFIIVLAGPGKFAVDELIRKRLQK
jgi:putative oxidoreductase